MISWGQIENTVKLNEQMSTIVQDYNNYLDSVYSSSLPYAFQLDYQNTGEAEFIVISPVFYLSGFGSKISPLHAFVDEKLVVIYFGFEKYLAQDSVYKENIQNLYGDFVIDDRILLDKEGNIVVPLVDAKWEYGIFEIKDSKVISRKFQHRDKMYFY
jgi:hypothetical protein